jgi:predicted ribosome quality control (RQC) complex YloA/Tae2 family protein
MTVLDVRACVAGLRNQLLGARVANVYDLDPKTYLIKTAKGGEKVLLLLESGIRFHSTSFNRDKSNTPSGFTLKLRKHIRTKKVEEVRQLGVDRLVAFTFGAGDEAFHLVLELFAGGNIILLDHECKIISLLRTHTDEATGSKTAVGEIYSMSGQRENRKITMELLSSVLCKAAPHEKALIKDILTKELDYGLALVEHAMVGAKIDLKRKALEFDPKNEEEMSRLLSALEEVDQLVANLGAEGRAVPGYIIRKDNKEESPYDDFAPVLLRQFETKAVVQFDSLDKAMDAFFTVAEGQRIEQQKAQQQKAAISKVERVRRAHEASIQALQEEEARNYHKATLIEANLGDVDNAILVVNSLLSQGMDWGALKRVVKEESRKGNPIASLIHSLKLETNQITLMLTFGLDYLGEEEQTAPVTTVDVDLGCNAYTNAQSYYSTKKKVAQKADKTIQSGDKALKGAERKAKEELKRVDTKASIQVLRTARRSLRRANTRRALALILVVSR